MSDMIEIEKAIEAVEEASIFYGRALEKKNGYQGTVSTLDCYKSMIDAREHLLELIKKEVMK